MSVDFRYAEIKFIIIRLRAALPSPRREAKRVRVVNDSLNGCQSPSVTEPQRDKGDRVAVDEDAP